MRPFLRSLFAVSLSAAALQAADPAASNEARLREALRAVTQQLQASEAERATAQAAQAILEQAKQELTKKLATAEKDLAEERKTSAKTIGELKSETEQQKTEIARLNESLVKWKAGFEKTAALARKTEEERQKSAAAAASLRNRVADLERKNLTLFNLGNEILKRYESYGLGKALAAREPFIGTTRVKLENEVQGYQDRLLDPKLKP